MDGLLSSGRTATLGNWLSASPPSVPLVRVAFAELAFREGRFYESEALAALAVSELAHDVDLAARASLVAGRAAHVASRESQALAYFGRARAITQDSNLARQAASGELLAMIELEDSRAGEVLQALAGARTLEPTDQILLADRELAYTTRFSVPVDLNRGRAARQLLHLLADPVARSSFRNILGYALASTAHFDEAEELTDEQLRDAERCRLDFVIPYALTIRALTASGRREYRQGAALLDDADERALRTGDVAAFQASAAVRIRMLVAQGHFEAAIAHADVDLSTATRSLHGELLAVHALARAGAGHSRRAIELAEAALKVSIGVETGISANSALAVVALSRGEQEQALVHARAALARAIDTGMIESMVSAYRGNPELVVCLLQQRALHDDVDLLLTRAGDKQVVLPESFARGNRSVMSLSPREKEVLALLAQGLSNAQIGKSLYISPVTVKAHVRHIFEKLGVHSRAAAAVRATQLNRD
jgi:DNA-binding NarL/FixJ family response regulator